MAIAVDAVTTDPVTVEHDSHSFSHTCTGSDLVLFLTFSAFDASAGSVLNVDSATYGGQALTKAISKNFVNEANTEIWYLEDPPTGSNTMSVALTASDAKGSVAIAHSYTGADQVQNPESGSAVTNTPSITVTTTSANSWVIAGVTGHGADTSPFSPDSGDQEQWDTTSNGQSFADCGATGGYLVTTSTGAYTWGTTASATDGHAYCGVELTEAAAVGTDMQINIGDDWKLVPLMLINIGDAWKTVEGAQINIGDAWKTLF